MSWTQSQTGTTSALSIGSETQLGSDDTNNGTFEVEIQTGNLALGDTLVLKVYSKVLTGDTVTNDLVWQQTYSNAQITNAKRSPPIASLFSLRATLTQTVGTGRTFPWSINYI